MSDFNTDNDFDNLEEFEEYPEEGGEERPPRASNRNFKIVLAIIGAIIVVILIAVVIYFAVIAPNQSQAIARQQTADAIKRTNDAIAFNATATAVMEQTKAAGLSLTLAAKPTDTPQPSPTAVVVFPTETPTATNTSLPLPQATQDFINTQTAVALATQSAGQATITPTATGLPGTGFADEVGLPMMIGMAIVLLAVIIAARRLRFANR